MVRISAIACAPPSAVTALLTSCCSFDGPVAQDSRPRAANSVENSARNVRVITSRLQGLLLDSLSQTGRSEELFPARYENGGWRSGGQARPGRSLSGRRRRAVRLRRLRRGCAA